MKALVTGGGGFHRLPSRRAPGRAAATTFGSSTTSPPAGARTCWRCPRTSSSSRATSRATSASTTPSAGCELVFHQAALPSVPRSVQDPLTSNATNITGTLNVLLAARDAGVRRVRLRLRRPRSTAPAPRCPSARTCRREPISPYAVAKLACEGYCRSFGDVYGLETVALRYFNVFGPRQDPRSQYAAVIPNFITGAAWPGERPTVFGDGEQSRDFTYVQNVVEANLLAMDAQGVAGQVFNVACGRADHAQPAARRAAASCSTRTSRPSTSRPARRRAATRWPTSPGRETALGYEPSVDLREGLRRTIEHYQAGGPCRYRRWRRHADHGRPGPHPRLRARRAVTFVAVRPVIALARRTDFYDHPAGYKEHDAPTPYLGGLAVFAGFAAAAVAFGHGTDRSG